MKRYQKKSFARLAQGQGYSTAIDGGYDVASKIQIDDDFRFKLSSNFVMSELSDDQSNSVKQLRADDNYLYALVYDGAVSKCKLYRSSDGETWTLRYTFSTALGGSNGFYVTDNNLIVVVGDYRTAYSQDGGNTFSELAAHYINDLVYFENYFYLAGVDGTGWWSIQRTQDFVTYEIIAPFPVGQDLDVSLAVVNGLLYASQAGYFCAIDLTDGTIRKIHKFTHVNYVYDSKGIFFIEGNPTVFGGGGTDTKIYYFDGSEVKFIRKIKGMVDTFSLFVEGEYCYFMGGDGNVYRIDSDGKYFFVEPRPTLASVNSGIIWAVPFSGYRVYWEYSVPTNKSRIHKSKNYQVVGTIETGDISEGEIVPRQLILKYKSLDPSVGVKVYVQKDKSDFVALPLLQSLIANTIRNPTMLGAVLGVIGSGGSLPTNWLSIIYGTLTIIAIGVQDGISYIEFRFQSGGGSSHVLFEPYLQIPAVQGQSWVSSYYLQLVGGTLTNLVLSNRFAAWNSVGTYLNDSMLNIVPTSAPLSSQYFTHSWSPTHANTAYIQSGLRLNALGVVDVTLRIGIPFLVENSTHKPLAKAKYSFPREHGLVDYINFRLELLTNNVAKTPEEVELEFLYLPVGLENAQ